MDLPPLFALHVWWARRPLVASTGAILASLMPTWTPDLAELFSGRSELATEHEYHEWFLQLCGILGDPASAEATKSKARLDGVRLSANPYSYKPAFKNPIPSADIDLLHELVDHIWGRSPVVLDPTAGGGSIPFQAIRIGLTAHANDLNSVAASVLKASVELPARFGNSIVGETERWGQVLLDRLRHRLGQFFPADSNETVTNYLFARAITCPRTGKPVPLAPNWWLSRGKTGTAVEPVTERNGNTLDEPEFDIVRGKEIDKRATDSGTITRGVAVSPWDNLTIDGDYIKAEAQAGRMGSILYAVAVRTGKGRDFRTPTSTDLAAIEAAGAELEQVLSQWEVDDVLPDEAVPDGHKTSEPKRYGIRTWRDMFSPRQLLVHGTFVEEYRILIPEVREAISDRDRADAVLSLLALVQGKTVNYDALLSSWHAGRSVTRGVFDRHDFAFKWTYAEMEGADDLYRWALLRGVLRAYKGLASLLDPTLGEIGELDRGRRIGDVYVTQGNAGDMNWMEDRSVELVCIDPPYYDNVMYAELADFFYVWEKRTLGRLWPKLFADELTNKDEEAVANVARFEHAGRRKQDLATLDYERKMTAIFAECNRILVDAGSMTVMFTHKKAEAWDRLVSRCSRRDSRSRRRGRFQPSQGMRSTSPRRTLRRRRSFSCAGNAQSTVTQESSSMRSTPTSGTLLGKHIPGWWISEWRVSTCCWLRTVRRCRCCRSIGPCIRLSPALMASLDCYVPMRRCWLLRRRWSGCIGIVWWHTRSSSIR